MSKDFSTSTLSKFGNIFDNKKIEEKNKEEEIKEKLRKEIMEEINTEVLPKENNINNYKKNIDLIKQEWKKELSYFDEITNDPEISEFLKVKSAELLLTGSVYSLKLGEIAEAVFEKIGKQGSKSGLYLKWAKFNGFSESTLKRYRNHWTIYNSVKDEVKPLIKMLKQSQIKIILKNDTIRELIYESPKMTMEELNSILLEDKIEDKIEDKKREKFNVPKDIPEFNLKKFNDMFNEVDKLEDKKREKFIKLIEELNKLLED